MLELMGETVGDIVECTGRAISCARRDIACVLLLVGIGVVVEVALVVDATGRLLSAPDLLLAILVWEGLWKGGGSSGEGTALLGGEVWRVGEAEVELQTVWIAAVRLLLLLLVGHLERQSA